MVPIDIVSGNCLTGDEPLPEPMLTQIYVTLWHHSATIILQWIFILIMMKS